MKDHIDKPHQAHTVRPPSKPDSGAIHPEITVIVLGFRNFTCFTLHCLESLLPSADNPAIEFLVLDNGSSDDSAKLTEAWCAGHPRFRYLASANNLGFAGGMNFGAAQANGRWLLLVNNDTLFPEGALEGLLRVVRGASQDIAIVGPITNAAGNGQNLSLPGASTRTMLEIGQSLVMSPTGELIPTYRIDFFCAAIRRTVWTQLGGLDVGFGLGYYEDFDFSLRVRDAGFRQLITEDVFIVHVGGATFKDSPEQRALLKRNKKLLKARHREVYFEHCREGNLAVLQAYRRMREAGRWSLALQRRLELRLTTLEADVPRSLLKRWLWQRKVRSVQAYFAGNID